jgi:hypothetical protein
MSASDEELIAAAIEAVGPGETHVVVLARLIVAALRADGRLVDPKISTEGPGSTSPEPGPPTGGAIGCWPPLLDSDPAFDPARNCYCHDPAPHVRGAVDHCVAAEKLATEVHGLLGALGRRARERRESTKGESTKGGTE